MKTTLISTEAHKDVKKSPPWFFSFLTGREKPFVISNFKQTKMPYSSNLSWKIITSKKHLQLLIGYSFKQTLSFCLKLATNTLKSGEIEGYDSTRTLTQCLQPVSPLTDNLFSNTLVLNTSPDKNFYHPPLHRNQQKVVTNVVRCLLFQTLILFP